MKRHFMWKVRRTLVTCRDAWVQVISATAAVPAPIFCSQAPSNGVTMLLLLFLLLGLCRCRFAAAHQPFVLIPGANHADTSNGVFNNSRGDIPSQADLTIAQTQMGTALGAFMTAHESVDAGARTAAVDELLLRVRQTAELVGPYFMASGAPRPSAGRLTHMVVDVAGSAVTGDTVSPMTMPLPDKPSHAV